VYSGKYSIVWYLASRWDAGAFATYKERKMAGSIEGKWDIDSQGNKVIWEITKDGDTWEAYSTAMGQRQKFDNFIMNGDTIVAGLSMMGMNIVMGGTYDPATDTIKGTSKSSFGDTPFVGTRME
jgi:hypothetical protein